MSEFKVVTIDASTPATIGDIPVWDGTKYVNQAVSGSGNSAFIKVTTDISTTNSAGYDTIFSQALTITGTVLDIDYDASGAMVSPGDASVYLVAFLDGVILPHSGSSSTVGNGQLWSVGMFTRVTGLTPGTHTVDLKWSVNPSCQALAQCATFQNERAINMLLSEPRSSSGIINTVTSASGANVDVDYPIADNSSFVSHITIGGDGSDGSQGAITLTVKGKKASGTLTITDSILSGALPNNSFNGWASPIALVSSNNLRIRLAGKAATATVTFTLSTQIISNVNAVPAYTAGGGISDTYANILAIVAPTEGTHGYPTDGGRPLIYTAGRWQTMQSYGALGTPILAATLSTHLNWAGATALADSNGTLIMTCATNGTLQYRGAVASFTPGSSYGVVGLPYTNPGVGAGSLYPMIMLYESGSGKAAVFYLDPSGTGAVASYWSNPLTRTSFTLGTVPKFFNNSSELRPIRIDVVSSNASFEYLNDDLKTWTSIATYAITTMFTTAPDAYGIGFVTSAGGGDVPMYVPELRKY